MTKYVIKNNPPVYGACFNVDKEKYKDCLACCFNLPNLDLINRRYRWITEPNRLYFLEHNVKVLKVKFSGGLHFVRRDIFEKIPYSKVPLKDPRAEIEKEKGYGNDLAFAHYCDFLNIPIIVDLRIKLKHLRYYSGPILQEKRLDYLKYDQNKKELCLTKSHLLLS